MGRFYMTKTRNESVDHWGGFGEKDTVSAKKNHVIYHLWRTSTIANMTII